MKVLLILAAVLHLGCLEEVREPFRVPDLCTEVGPDQGNCGDYNVRWFFNPEDGQCKQFMYSGCGGNQNNFKTLEECEKMCKGIPEKDDQQEMTSGDDQPPTETASTESTPKEAKEASEKEAKQDKGVNTETVEDQETNLDNKSEDDAEENDEEGLDDGEEDEELINKFLNVGDGMSVEDSQALKEAMAAFDVSVLQEVPSEEQINMEDEQQEQREQQVEQQQEQQPDQQQQQQQQQQQIEGQAEMNENINQQHEESQAAHGDQPNEDMAAGSVTEQQTGNNEDDGYMEETSQQLRSFLDGLHVAITPEDRETIQEGISEYGATVMEAQQDVAEEMESVQYQEQQANQEKDISGEVKGAQQELDSANAELEEAHADISSVNVPPEPAMEGSDGDITDGDDDEDDDDDDEPEGIDVEEEYPPLKGMLSPEDQATLAEAISAFDVVEAVSNRREMEGEVVARIPLSEDVSEESLDQENVAKEETEAGKSEQTTTSSPSHSTTEATEQQSTEDVIHEDKAAILNPNEMNDQDRQMLNELVSNYDVNVVQERSDPDKTEDSEKSDETNEPADSEAEDTESNGLLSPRCTLPPVSGPCRARMIRWYFDMDTGKCTSFVYGGCRGNGNRFISRRKCMASCLATRDQRPVFLPTNGLPVTPTHNPAIHPMPTQSPTKKITFMMPLLGLFNKRTPPSSAGMSSFRQLPQPTQSQMPQMADRGNKGRRMTPSSAFQGRDVMSTIRHGSMAMKTRPQPATEETESNGDQFRPPFSPFRYLITRAMFKTTINHREAPSAPSDGQKVQSNPLPSRIRIVLPRGQAAKMPSFQKQQPVPKLGPMRPLMQLIEQLRLPLFDRGRARAFGQRDDNNNENMDRPPAPAIFAPKMVKKSEFESLNHDNRHLNMVSPNNKFTLLQVFVNKHGGHQNMADPAVRMRQPAGPTNKLAPSRMSPEPFNQAIRSFQPSDNRPMLSMRPAYGPYQTGVWTGSQPALPPHMSYVHYHQHGYPFQYAIHRPIGGIPLPQLRPQPMARRPPIIRPLVITTREEEAEEEESDQPHYACLLPLAPGPCKSYQTKWYYNRDSGKCEIFYYTGCAGNANNFETWEECAATCLETPSELKSTIPSEVSDSSRTSDDEKAEEDERPDTIIVTSTRYPDNEAEARQAIEEAKTEAPSADNKKDTAEEEREGPKERVESEEKEQMNEVQKEEEEQSKQNELVDKHVVISEVGAMSTHYILLLAVITIVALAVIVLVTISIVHLCRKMRAGKKERVLEAVIKQQLSAEAPHLVYTTKPAPEQTEKPQV